MQRCAKFVSVEMNQNCGKMENLDQSYTTYQSHSAVLQLGLGVCEQIVTIRDKLPFPAMTSNTCFGSHSGEVKKYSLR